MVAAEQNNCEKQKNMLIKFIDFLYNVAVNGHKAIENLDNEFQNTMSKTLQTVVGKKTCEELAEEYLQRYGDVHIAAKKFISSQVKICATSGFVTGFGGFSTMALLLPANIVSVIFVQLRMIAVIATMGGFNARDDEVKTFAYICLVGMSFTDLIKNAGIKIANKTAQSLLKQLPGKILIAINQKVGYRLFTRFGQKGVVNLAKGIPLAGAVFGGAIDLIATKTIAKRACQMFLSKS